MGDGPQDHVLKCLYGNLQSLNSKKREIELRLTECDYDILLFTEVWINEEMQACEYSFSGYQEPVIDPSIRGGACIYVKQGLEFFTVQPPMKMSESVWIVIKTRENINRLYACIYRSPNSVNENNVKLLENIEWAKNHYSELILVGDYNLPQINWDLEQTSSEYSNMFLECIRDNGIEQMIAEPTRFRNDQTPSLLDLLLVSDPDIINYANVNVPLGKSDHCTIEFSVKNSHKINDTHKTCYDFEKIDSEKFQETINSYDWNMINDRQLNFDTTYEIFIDAVNQAITSSAPIRKRSHMNKAPWTTRLVHTLSRRKRKLWDKYKFSGLAADYENYKNVRNSFDQKKDIAILNYENKIIAGKNTNPKQFYNYVSLKNKYGHNKIVLNHNDVIETNETKCANILNDFFGSVFTTGESNLPEFEPSRNYEKMPDISLTAENIKKKLEQLDIHKAAGPDQIPCLILKKFSDLLTPILLRIFRRSYEESRVPLQMKEALIVPLHKSGSKLLTNNYRPVSLTPIIAKVLESLMYDALLSHVEDNDILNDVQHGFRRNRSTNSNLLFFWDKVTSLADKKNEVSIIYTDLRKAFDSVPHDLLCFKLMKYGVEGANLGWIEDFLKLRRQKVRIGQCLSSSIAVESGVPQGGVLSGLMFILYMNDLPDCLKFCQISMYADDAKLYAPITGPAAVTAVQQDLDRFSAWCRTWRMRLNAEKCFFLHYVPQNRNKTYPIYYLDGVPLIRRESATDLGVVVEDDFKFHAQVSGACKKASKQINTIRRTFMSRNPKFLESMFKTYVRPHLEYCVQVWNPVYIGDINRMEKVQNRFTRFLPQSRVMSQEERNQRLNITSHESRRLRGDLVYMYKLYESQLFTSSNETRTRGHPKRLKIEITHNNLRKHSFAARNADAWNSLPESVVCANSLDEFKARLDAHYTS